MELGKRGYVKKVHVYMSFVYGKYSILLGAEVEKEGPQ